MRAGANVDCTLHRGNHAIQPAALARWLRMLAIWRRSVSCVERRQRQMLGVQRPDGARAGVRVKFPLHRSDPARRPAALARKLCELAAWLRGVSCVGDVGVDFGPPVRCYDADFTIQSPLPT